LRPVISITKILRDLVSETMDYMKLLTMNIVK